MKKKDTRGSRVSVVVCTYNRSALLRSCLESLASQTASADGFEVIVVDNNSTDDTRSVADSFAGALAELRVISEERQGLSWARNRGWRAARGEYVAFLDDDARAPSRWIEVLAEIVAAHEPDVVGGPIHPFYTSPKPDWFKDEYEIRVHQRDTGWMEKGFISGSNLIVRKALLEEIGGFDTELGMSAGSIAYGEDTELVKRARGRGKRIYYSLELVVLHHVPPQKMDILYAMNAAFRNGLTTHELWWEGRVGYSEIEAVYGALRSLFDGLNKAVSDGGFDRERYPFKENFIFENCLRPLSTLGVLAGHAQKHGVGGRSFFAFVRTWAAAKVRALLGG
jgi:glucosyl-dolichyl phosphate glucuronosyltransferase